MNITPKSLAEFKRMIGNNPYAFSVELYEHTYGSPYLGKIRNLLSVQSNGFWIQIPDRAEGTGTWTEYPAASEIKFHKAVIGGAICDSAFVTEINIGDGIMKHFWRLKNYFQTKNQEQGGNHA